MIEIKTTPPRAGGKQWKCSYTTKEGKTYASHHKDKDLAYHMLELALEKAGISTSKTITIYVKESKKFKSNGLYRASCRIGNKINGAPNIKEAFCYSEEGAYDKLADELRSSGKSFKAFNHKEVAVIDIPLPGDVYSHRNKIFLEIIILFVTNTSAEIDKERKREENPIQIVFTTKGKELWSKNLKEFHKTYIKK